MVITLSSVLPAFLVAAGVAVFFGFYPANKAERLKPTEALRYQQIFSRESQRETPWTANDPEWMTSKPGYRLRT